MQIFRQHRKHQLRSRERKQDLPVKTEVPPRETDPSSIGIRIPTAIGHRVTEVREMLAALRVIAAVMAISRVVQNLVLVATEIREAMTDRTIDSEAVAACKATLMTPLQKIQKSVRKTNVEATVRTRTKNPRKTTSTKTKTI